MNKRVMISRIAVPIFGFWAMSGGAMKAQQQWGHAGPLPRSNQTAVLDLATNRMIVFGGAAGAASLNLNDVWWLSNPGGVGMNWTRAPITGTKPAPRGGPTAVYDPGS